MIFWKGIFFILKINFKIIDKFIGKYNYLMKNKKLLKVIGFFDLKLVVLSFVYL